MQVLFKEMAAQKNSIAGYDDKCGSEYIHLPSPKGGREPGMITKDMHHVLIYDSIKFIHLYHTAGDVASRWKYRIGLQGNLFPGALYQLSIVPPNLKTGVNFGCTAFVGSLYRLLEKGKLGDTVCSHITLFTSLLPIIPYCLL